MKRTVLSIFFILIIAALCSVIVILLFNTRREAPARIADPPRSTPVEVLPVMPQRYVHSVNAYGTVFPIRKGIISSQVMGTVEFISKDLAPGVRVAAGQRLARIRDVIFKIQYEKAKAILKKSQARLQIELNENRKRAALFEIARQRLAMAEADYSRKEALWKKKLIAERELDMARSQLELVKSEFERAKAELESRNAKISSIQADLASARAGVERAEEDLLNTLIKAPFDGIITGKFVELGDHVAPGKKLFTVVDISRIKVEAKVSSNDIVQLMEGAEAEVMTEAIPGRIFSGKIAHINVQGDARSRSFSVEIEISNRRKPFLLPGMFAKVRIPVREFPDAIMVPRDSILWDKEGAYLFLADTRTRKAVKRKVSLGPKTEREVLVLKGLKEGDLLIVTGQHQLQDGSLINVSARQ